MKSLKHYIISILGVNRIFQNKVRFGAYQVTQTEQFTPNWAASTLAN